MFLDYSYDYSCDNCIVYSLLRLFLKNRTVCTAFSLVYQDYKTMKLCVFRVENVMQLTKCVIYHISHDSFEKTRVKFTRLHAYMPFVIVIKRFLNSYLRFL